MENEKNIFEDVKGRASAMFKDVKSLADEARDKADSLINGDKSWWDKTKSWAGNSYDKGKEYAGKALDTVKDAGKSMDDKTGGWLGDNKGLLMGGLVALLAVFGMEGGSIWPSLIAIGALLGGAFIMDKDTGMFSGMFKNKDEPSKSTGPSKEIQPTTPTVTAPDVQKAVPTGKSKDNKAYISFNGGDIYIDTNGNKKTPPLDKIPSLMHIKVDGTGKATHVSVADESGKLLRNDGKEQMVTIVDSDIKFDILVDKSGAKHIDLNDEKNMPALIVLRKIGTEVLNKSKGQPSSLQNSDSAYTSLGTLASPHISASAKKEQNQTSV
ncbi:MAG: hypothetical protein ABL867_09290 [Rickettsiales bacterium]